MAKVKAPSAADQNADERKVLVCSEERARKILLENPYSEPATPFPEQAYENQRRREALAARPPSLLGPRPPPLNRPTVTKYKDGKTKTRNG
jgi:hypothetical protein